MRRAFAFLSIFGRASAPAPSALVWFPLVGVVLGSLVGVTWWLGAHWWPPLVAALIALVADFVLTGLLHVDGLADAGDGLIAPLSREERLRVMSDPAIGAFGLTVVVVVVLLRVASLGALTANVAVLAGLWCASRAALVVIVLTQPYARPGGLASAFLTTASTRLRWATYGSTVLGLAGAGALLFLGNSWRGLIALATELLTMGAVVQLARRRLGGYTGDVLGASLVLGETLGLLSLVAR